MQPVKSADAKGQSAVQRQDIDDHYLSRFGLGIHWKISTVQLVGFVSFSNRDTLKNFETRVRNYTKTISCTVLFLLLLSETLSPFFGPEV
jgi:hypothetical protein